MSRCSLYSMPRKVFSQAIIVLMFTLLFVNIFCLTPNIVTVNALEAGVKKGDWITYEVNYTENVPSIYPLYTRREVMDVKGTVLTINTTYLMSDETVSTNTADGDVVNGSGPCALVFIPANLGVGNFVYIQDFSDDPIMITDETTRTYSIRDETQQARLVTRTVIYAEFTASGFDIAIYWDKQKGTALEIYGAGTYTSISAIYGTNMWSSSVTPTMGLEAIIFLIIMAILASVLAYGYIQSQKNIRKQKKKSYR